MAEQGGQEVAEVEAGTALVEQTAAESLNQQALGLVQANQVFQLGALPG